MKSVKEMSDYYAKARQRTFCYDLKLKIERLNNQNEDKNRILKLEEKYKKTCQEKKK